ncbi:winged helix-turn-helix domain-containing protein [Paraburkholderia sp.]|uniref:ATP-binding protein n=1 Tax=Paraburkholderia sp. TaxID=1926495 RepID=UPI002387B80D|nr:winged helix-turn-helix domain-containing protein [Paraburkholderia sp.]MDE1182341.1 winged helix-turn-helix domain-containing protein [Paraburkholderia sp.]
MIKIGHFEIDLALRVLRKDGEPVHVGSRAFDILVVLASADGRLVRKDELMDAVWPDTIVEENNLQVHLSTLRKVLGADRDCILTVPGRGYRLVQRRSDDAPATIVRTRVVARLPAQRTGVIGRDAAVAQVHATLDTTRVLTLTGAGGIGKTTLAIAVAHRLAAEQPDSVCFVELAALKHEDAILAAIADSCGGLDPDVVPRIDAIVALLAGQPRLLLLDNAEHVIGYVAALVERLIASHDALRVLVTSREPLRISPEVVFRVEPLDVPSRDATEHEILEQSSVHLFMSRAQALQGKVWTDRTEIARVGEICRRLDGIPLAIELAAARVVAFGVEGVYRRLDDRMAILAGGYRTALPRHQTLRATFDWSFALLDPDAKSLFRRLAMFGGVFSLEAMCAVACDDALTIGAVIDGIGELAAKSMVSVELDGPVAKYRLTESTRAYALEQLHAEGESQEIAARNARYLASRFRQGACASSSSSSALARFEGGSDLQQTLDDARSAFDWAFSDEGDLRLGVELASTLVGALLECCLIEECGRRAARAVAALGDLPAGAVDAVSEMRIRAALASVLPNLRGPIKCAADLWHDVLALAVMSQNDEFQARALWGLWNAMLSAGNVHQALFYAKRFQQFAQARGSRWQHTLATSLTAVAQHCLGQHACARAKLEACIRDLSAYPDDARQIKRFAVEPLAICYSGLARIVWVQGDAEQALEFADKAVNLIHPATMEPWFTHTLGVVAIPLALLSGDYRRGKHYLAITRSQTALHDFTIWREYCECVGGHLDVLEGRPEAGLATLETALDSLIQRGFRRLITPLIVACAEALIAAGRFKDASKRLNDALEFCQQNGKLFFLPEVWRALGVVAQAQAAMLPEGDDARRHALIEAQASFDEAIELSRAHGARMWELRATLGLAQLLRSQDRDDDALAALRDIALEFDRSSRVPDVAAMFALLDSLSASDARIVAPAYGT